MTKGLTLEMASADVLDRMADRFTVGDDCWLWTGRVNDSGYAVIDSPRSTGESRPLRVHRVLYVALVGPIPDELPLDHTCHNADKSCPGGRSCRHRRCIRPFHLEPATIGENVRRGFAARREGAA